MAAPPPPLFRAPEQLVPLQIHKRRLILNSSFSCGSHWLCICPVLARPAYPVPAAPSCPGSRLLWSWGLGPQRPPRKLRVASIATLRRGKEQGWAHGSLHIPSSSGQSNKLCGPGRCKSVTSCPGARSRDSAGRGGCSGAGWGCVCSGLLDCPRAVEKLTPSLRLQS